MALGPQALGSRWPLRLALLGLLLWGSLTAASTAGFAVVQSASGSAFGEQVDALDGAIISGPLPSVTGPAGGGAPVTSSVASACVPAALCRVLRAGALRATTLVPLGGDAGIQGRATAAEVNVGDGIVTADAVRSQCTGSAGGLIGGATLTNVRVGGMLVGSRPARNTIIYVGGMARVTLNEQIVSSNSVTVNAIHVQLLSGSVGNVILLQTHCDVTESAEPVAPDSPLNFFLPLLVMATLMGAVVVAWRRDPLFRRSTR